MNNRQKLRLAAAVALLCLLCTAAITVVNLATQVTGTLATGNGGTGVTDQTYSGNTHKACTASGTLTSGNAVKFDASGNCVDGGGTVVKTVYLTSAYTNATTTLSNVTGLSFSVAASTNYQISCALMYQGSASTAGLAGTFTGPTSPTSVAMGMYKGGTSVNAASAFGTSIGGAAAVPVATNLTATTTLGLVNGANSGTVQLQAAAIGAGTLTIQPGSYCTLYQ